MSTNEIPPLGTLLHLSNEETNGLRDLSVSAVLVWDYGWETTFTGGLRGACSALFRSRFVLAREDPTVETCAPTFRACPEGSLVSRHLPDGEFGWGGISVTQQRRCPKASSVGTEISRRTQASRLA